MRASQDVELDGGEFRDQASPRRIEDAGYERPNRWHTRVENALPNCLCRFLLGEGSFSAVRRRSIANLLAAGAVATALLFGPLATSALAAAHPDMRGTFYVIAVDGGASYPQYWIITSENLQTGAYSGTDSSTTTSNPGYTLSGVVTGTSFTTNTATGGYRSTGHGTLTGNAGSFQVGGVFSDTNNTTGTFTGHQIAGASTSTTVPSPAPTTGRFGMSIAAYCLSLGYATAHLQKGAISGPDFAYANWACVSSGGQAVMIATSGTASPGMDDLCRVQYPTRTMYARPTSRDNAYSWRCFNGVDPVLTASSTSTGNPARSTISSSLASPSQAFGSVGHTVLNAVIAGAAVLFIAFPSQLFNHTFQENYVEIAEWWRRRIGSRTRLRRWLSDLFAAGAVMPATAAAGVASSDESLDPDPTVTEPMSASVLVEAAPAALATEAMLVIETEVVEVPKRSVIARMRAIPGLSRRVIAVIAIGGLFGVALDPRVGLNATSFTSYLAVLASTVIGIALPGFIIHRYRKIRGRGLAFELTAIPIGLAIALVCVVVSRITSFQPGYLYGIICGVSFADTLNTKEQGHTVALAMLGTVGLATLAWLLWIPVDHLAAHQGEFWPVVLLDDLLATIFTGGIVGATIGSFPLRFLPGGTVAAWHKGAWAVIATVVTFLFVSVMLNPSTGGHPGHAGLVTIFGLLIAFGGGSVWFYLHFERKKKEPAT